MAKQATSGEAQPEVRKVLSVETTKAIKTYVEASTKAERAQSRAADLLVAAGVNWEWLLTSKGHEADPITIDGVMTTRGEFHEEIKEDIVAGFTTTVQALLATPTKGMDDAKKSEKRYWQQQIGSKQKDLRNAVKRRQESGDSDPSPNRTRSPDVRIVEYLNNARKIAEADENPTYYVRGLIEAIDKAIQIVSTNVAKATQ